MASPEPSNPTFDPDLGASFSDLAISPGDQTRGTFATFDSTLDPSTSSFSQAHDTPFPSMPAIAGFDQFQSQTNTDSQLYASSDNTGGGAPSSSAMPFACDFEGCTRAFPRQCDLDKHYHNHTKRRRCDLCGGGGAETKDLNRHMWAHHPDEARARGIPREEDVCPRCGYRGRKDNVKRHRESAKH